MIKKRALIISVIFILSIPLYIWVIQPTLERYQISNQAEAYFNQIPEYSGSERLDKALSFYSIGYGYRYRITTDPEEFLKYYLDKVIQPWISEGRNDTGNSKGITFKRLDSALKLSVSIMSEDGLSIKSPPYIITVRVYKP